MKASLALGKPTFDFLGKGAARLAPWKGAVHRLARLESPELHSRLHVIHSFIHSFAMHVLHASPMPGASGPGTTAVSSRSSAHQLTLKPRPSPQMSLSLVSRTPAWLVP